MLLNLTFESTLIKHLRIGCTKTAQELSAAGANSRQVCVFSMNLFHMTEELKITHRFQGKVVCPSWMGILRENSTINPCLGTLDLNP